MNKFLAHSCVVASAICVIGGCSDAASVAATPENNVAEVTTPRTGNPDMANLNGLWMLYSAEDFGEAKLTELGETMKGTYDFASSDPALKCIPASWTRVYSNPQTPIEVSVDFDEVTIRYELFDIVRKVPIVSSPEAIKLTTHNTKHPELGKSVAWYEDGDLVIYTAEYGDDIRVLSTIRQWAGLHQSPLMATSERYKRDGDQLNLEITHFDPVIYKEPLTVHYALDIEPDFGIEDYGCVAQNAAVNSVE